MNAATEAATVVSYLEERFGLSFAGPRHARLMEALERARSGSGAASYSDLREALDTHDELLADLVAALTVGETYFFRERPQLELLARHILPDTAAHAVGPIRIWSVGCATGEEAYTLAMVAEEAGLGHRCRVTGTDLSAHAVERARARSYGRWALRSVTAVERDRYFHRRGDRYVVDERFEDRVRFLQHNALDGAPGPGRFDVIFCRNVLIYLTRDAVLRTAVSLRDALRPDGWLVTASGDPPLEIDGLERIRTPSGLAYRREDAQQRPFEDLPVPSVLTGTPSLQPAPAVASPSPLGESIAAGGTEPLWDATVEGPDARAKTADRPETADRAGAAEEVETAEIAKRIRQLGDAGRVQEAAAVAEQAVSAHPLDAELRYLTAVVLLESGRLDMAAAAAAATVYLDPDLAVAHLLYGQIEHRRGNHGRARRGFRNAARLLRAVPADAVPALAGDVPAAHLAALAGRYLHAEGEPSS